MTTTQPGKWEQRLVRKDLNKLIDLEFEYQGHILKFQDVSMTGTLHWSHATLMEPAWCYYNFEIDMTPKQAQEWVVEDFEDNELDVPPWAYIDGKEILIEMRDHAEQHVFID